jgi:hypothetical protein
MKSGEALNSFDVLEATPDGASTACPKGMVPVRLPKTLFPESQDLAYGELVSIRRSPAPSKERREYTRLLSDPGTERSHLAAAIATDYPIIACSQAICLKSSELDLVLAVPPVFEKQLESPEPDQFFISPYRVELAPLRSLVSSRQDALSAALQSCLNKNHAVAAIGLLADLSTRTILWTDCNTELLHFGDLQIDAYAVTPGSLAFPLIAAAALEHGVINLDTVIDLGDGSWRVSYPDGKPSARVVREAEGALVGVHTFAEGLAGGVYSAAAQGGQRLSDSQLRDFLGAIGLGTPWYADYAILGQSRTRGYAKELPPLPWDWVNTHTSVTFGAEYTCTLRQLFTAFAAVLDDGTASPSLDFNTDRLVYPHLWEQRHICSSKTVNSVREIARKCLLEGTGRPASAFQYATAAATGTTTYLPHMYPSPKYFATMITAGRLDESSRELVALVAVDGPRGRERFGSRVAGETTTEILRIGLGLEEDGRLRSPEGRTYRLEDNQVLWESADQPSAHPREQPR